MQELSRIDSLEIKEWLEFNAKLQQKKNLLRCELAKKGMLKKGASNDYDHYKYFSEAQYKALFTELFSENKLELKFNEVGYEEGVGIGNQKSSRKVTLLFRLIDCETGFYEETIITGEALDKGDKAGYKAYTGALKYYLANTFMVATGDDPEKDSPTLEKEQKATAKQLQELNAMENNLKKWVLNKFNVGKLEDLTKNQAEWFLTKKKESTTQA